MANAWGTFVSMGYKPATLIDNWTKSIVFDAVYQSEIDNGKSQQEAINQANRAVAETQPASNHWQQARFSRKGGVSRLFFSQFMNALVPIFNMTFVDTYRNLIHPSWNSVKDTGLKLLAVSMSIGAAAWFKDYFSGRLPTGEEMPNGEVDDWRKWGSETLVDNFINIIPVFNRLTNTIRAVSGRRAFRNEDRLVEPFDNLLRGFKDLGDEDKRSAATGRIIEGLAQFGVPIPYNAIKQWLRFFGVGQDNQ